jgi:hypothetical protein
MDSRLNRLQQKRQRVASDRAHQIFRLAHRHQLSAELAESIYERANGDWNRAGELARTVASDERIVQDTPPDFA